MVRLFSGVSQAYSESIGSNNGKGNRINYGLTFDPGIMMLLVMKAHDFLHFNILISVPKEKKIRKTVSRARFSRVPNFSLPSCLENYEQTFLPFPSVKRPHEDGPKIAEKMGA